MRDPVDVYALHQQRKGELSPLLSRMADVASHYHDEVVLPLPELDSSERYSVPNLIALGIDQFGMRVADRTPDMTWPALDTTKRKSVERSVQRRQAAFGWWEASKMRLALRQRARWLVGYSSAPVLVTPDYATGMPRYEPRNPAMCLPGQKRNRFDVEVPDCLFSSRWTARALREQYGVVFNRTGRSAAAVADDTLIDCIEYLDDDQWLLLAVGPAQSELAFAEGYSNRPERGITNVRVAAKVSSGAPLVVLDNVIHNLGVCPVSVPGRFGLERAMGMMDNLLGTRELQARLMALEILSVERAIFPNEWALLDPTGNSEVIKLADGRAGIVGEIRGGQMLTTNVQPGQMTQNTINYLERAQRQNGLIPAEFGGESATQIRTGRRGEQVFAATVDQSIQEHHELLAASLEHENRIAVAWARKVFGKRPVSYYVTWPGQKGQITYVAEELFAESDRNVVSYSHAGADISQLIVNTAQMQGTGLISEDTARRMNPLVDDPDFEKQQVLAEKIEQAGLQAFQQAIVSGQVSLDDWSFVADLVQNHNTTLTDAIKQAQQRAQERQASSAPPGEPAGPVPPGSPEAQPGLAAGSPAEAGAVAPTVAPPGPSQTNLAGLLRALATTSRAAHAGG